MANYKNEYIIFGKDEFRLGNRVLLIEADYMAVPRKPSPYYPLKGTEFECLGTITFLGTTTCEVNWDNGTMSRVSYHFLNKVAIEKETEENNPNVAFRYHRWLEH